MFLIRNDSVKAVLQRGYALIAALMAVLLIMSVGIMAFMLSGKDLVISSRIVHEKKAFSAAEECVHEVASTLKPTPLAQLAITTKDATDTDCKYSATKPTPPEAPYYFGTGNSPDRGYILYSTDIKGEHKQSGSAVELNVEFGYGPVPIGTGY